MPLYVIYIYVPIFNTVCLVSSPVPHMCLPLMMHFEWQALLTYAFTPVLADL